MTLVAVVAAVSSALLLGALWGLYGRLGDRTEGFVLAAGGGALMLAAVLELIVPAQQASSFEATAAVVLFGAAVFAGIDYLIDERWGDEGGGGLLAAVTLDGVLDFLETLIAQRPTRTFQFSGDDDVPYADLAAALIHAAGADPSLLRPSAATTPPPGLEDFPHYTSLDMSLESERFAATLPSSRGAIEEVARAVAALAP